MDWPLPARSALTIRSDNFVGDNRHVDGEVLRRQDDVRERKLKLLARQIVKEISSVTGLLVKRQNISCTAAYLVQDWRLRCSVVARVLFVCGAVQALAGAEQHFFHSSQILRRARRVEGGERGRPFQRQRVLVPKFLWAPLAWTLTSAAQRTSDSTSLDTFFLSPAV